MPHTVSVSVIATVYNESASIRRLLNSLAAQTRPPDEIVICDGGSRDETVSILRSYVANGTLPQLRILIEPGANISRGRNCAIAAARGPVIAATDAGVRLDHQWLARLIAPWERATAREEPLAVAGFFAPDVVGTFQTAMAATVLPLKEDIDPSTFLPSSRSVAFTKAAWAAAGGYPEWLDYCEDLLFDFALNAQRPQRSTAFEWAPGAVVYFRPRETLPAFWRQYYRYARGDGKADLWRKRHAVRYAAYGALLPALIGHALWGRFARGLGWVGLLTGVIAYCWRPWRRVRVLGRNLPLSERLRAAALVPLIRGVGDLAKMAGYPVGLWWRWRHRHWDAVHWQDRMGSRTSITER